MMKQCFFMASALMINVFSSSVAAHAGHSHDTDEAKLEVSHAQVRAFLPGSKSSVGYLTISNHDGGVAKLTKATIEGLGRVEIHEHKHVNGMMKMQQVKAVTIKGHESLSFEPGGYHLMVFDPQEPLKVGQERKLTLYFSDGNRLFTNAQVVSLEAQAAHSKPSKKQHAHH